VDSDGRGGRGLNGSMAQSDVDCWVFDIDGCLVDSLSGTSLRPGARELLTGLCSRPSSVLLWSAGGGDYALERARQFGLTAHVNGFFAKDGRDAAATIAPSTCPSSWIERSSSTTYPRTSLTTCA